jgi:hypothetical protein
MDKLTPLFIFLTGAAVMLQAGILLAMYLAMRNSASRVEAIAADVKAKMLPTLEQTQLFLTEIGPKLHVIADNLQDSTTLLRDQVLRVDATVKDAMDRGRLQIIRADELVTRTLDRVEETSDMVHQTVISPVRRLSGLVQGLTVGLEFLFGSRGRRNGNNREERRPVPQDEMFI